MSNAAPPTPVRAVEPVRASLLVLGLIALAALVGLALEGNWPKLGRVGAAAAVYLSTLALWSRRAADLTASVPWWPFRLAGAAAGFLSGLVRPEIAWRLVAVQTTAAALLLGAVHWVAVRRVPRVRAGVVREPLREPPQPKAGT